jgi:hypothetical protein
VIQGALRRFGGNRRRAAGALNIRTVTLWRRMKCYGLGAGRPESDNLWSEGALVRVDPLHLRLRRFSGRPLRNGMTHFQAGARLGSRSASSGLRPHT